MPIVQYSEEQIKAKYPGKLYDFEYFLEVLERVEDMLVFEYFDYQQVENRANVFDEEKVIAALSQISTNLKMKLILGALKWTKNPGILIDFLLLENNIPFPFHPDENLKFIPGTNTRPDQELYFLNGPGKLPILFDESRGDRIEYFFKVLANRGSNRQLDYSPDEECFEMLRKYVEITKNKFLETNKVKFDSVANAPCFQMVLTNVLNSRSAFELVDKAIRDSRENKNWKLDKIISMGAALRGSLKVKTKVKAQIAFLNECLGNLLERDIALSQICDTENMKLMVRAVIRDEMNKGSFAKLLSKLNQVTKKIALNHDLAMLVHVLAFVGDQEMIDVFDERFPPNPEQVDKKLKPYWNISLSNDHSLYIHDPMRPIAYNFR